MQTGIVTTVLIDLITDILPMIAFKELEHVLISAVNVEVSFEEIFPNVIGIANLESCERERRRKLLFNQTTTDDGTASLLNVIMTQLIDCLTALSLIDVIDKLITSTSGKKLTISMTISSGSDSMCETMLKSSKLETRE